MFISTASNNSDGYKDAHDISTGSVALIVSAELLKKLGKAMLPGLDVIHSLLIRILIYYGKRVPYL